MDKNPLITTLQGIRFLHDIDPGHLEQIANISQPCEFDEHDVVFREGQPADDIYLVVSGKVSLQIGAGTAGCKLIVTVGPGEILGWSSLTDHPRFAATAIATERTRMIRIDGDRLQAICDSDPQFGYEFMRRTMLALAKRVTATWTQLEDVYVAHYVPITAFAAAQND